MNFWHGGNLDDYDDIIAQKNGRYEFGPGLYITTHYDTARKYSKGSRKMYLITVEKGNDLEYADLDVDKVIEFINKYIIVAKRKYAIDQINKFAKDGKVKGYLLNNIIVNEKAIKPSNTKYLRQFYIDNGIDYLIVKNAFGWGEKMMVLFNMKKIVNKIVIKPTDTILEYDLNKK
jgi:hypothetical protein